VDNPQVAGEKKCRKKNFFSNRFALYFAQLTAGAITEPRIFFLHQVWIFTLKSLVNTLMV